MKRRRYVTVTVARKLNGGLPGGEQSEAGLLL